MLYKYITPFVGGVIMNRYRIALFFLVLICFCPPHNSSAAGNQKSFLADKTEAYRLGYETARKEYRINGRAFLGGFAAGFFIPVIGPLTTGPLADLKPVSIQKKYLYQLNPDEQVEYKQGFSYAFRTRRIENYMLGGACGSLIGGVLIHWIAKSLEDFGMGME
jgi:hypothetical protein